MSVGTETIDQAALEPDETPGAFWIRLMLPLMLIAVIFSGPIFRVWMRWTNEEDYYSHGPLVPFIALYLVLRSRKKLTGEDAPETGPLYAAGIGALVLYFVFDEFKIDKRLLFGGLLATATTYVIYHLRKFKPEPWRGGLFLLLPALLLCVLASSHEIVSVAWFFACVTVIGLVMYYLGKRALLIMAFPLIFLFSSVPMPEFIVQRVTMPLKKLATYNTVQILHRGLGIYCENRGVVIMFAKSDLEIAEAGDGKLYKEVTVGAQCSGLRSLIALISFGLLFSYITPLSMVSKSILFAATIPASFIANLFRILTLSLVTYKWDTQTAVGDKLWINMESGPMSSLVPKLRDFSKEPVHDITGMMVFVVAFIGLFALERLLTHIEHRIQAKRDAASSAAAEAGDEPTEPAPEALNA
jgi:exosortase